MRSYVGLGSRLVHQVKSDVEAESTEGRAIPKLSVDLSACPHERPGHELAALIRTQGRRKPPLERHRVIIPSPADIPSAFEAASPHSVPVGSQIDLSDLKIKPE